MIVAAILDDELELQFQFGRQVAAGVDIHIDICRRRLRVRFSAFGLRGSIAVDPEERIEIAQISFHGVSHIRIEAQIAADIQTRRSGRQLRRLDGNLFGVDLRFQFRLVGGVGQIQADLLTVGHQLDIDWPTQLRRLQFAMQSLQIQAGDVEVEFTVVFIFTVAVIFTLAVDAGVLQ